VVAGLEVRVARDHVPPEGLEVDRQQRIDVGARRGAEVPDAQQLARVDAVVGSL
jgi:hypothetical protein